MADLAPIFSLTTQGSRLALDLYQSAAATPNTIESFRHAAKAVSNLCFTVKQIGTLIVEHDNLHSDEAIAAIDGVIDQGKECFGEIKSLTLDKPSGSDDILAIEYTHDGPDLGSARLNYLNAHVDFLSSTVSVIAQTLYTAQIISWTRAESAISPRHSETTIKDQKAQLEVLLIEQQSSYLQLSKAYENWQHAIRSNSEPGLEDSTEIILVDDEAASPRLADISQWRDPSLGWLTTSDSPEHWLRAICANSRSYLEYLLTTWTRLERTKQAEEHTRREERRRSQQPTFDTDSEDDELGALPAHLGKGTGQGRATPYPRSGGVLSPVQSPAMPTLPILIDTPRSSFSSATSPVSPRTSGLEIPFSTQPEQMVSPVEADAAVKAKELGDVGLGIPWTLRTRNHYWRHIDSKISKSSTDAPTSVAYSDRASWTEILASWVCKEALDEFRIPYTQMQKLRQLEEKTVMDPCFRIEKPLTFNQVQRLVERTVEIYRRNRPPSPQSKGRSFADRMQAQEPRYIDPRRSSASAALPALGRSISLNGVPTLPHVSTTHLPIPQQSFPHPFPHASTTNLHIPPPGPTPNLTIPHPAQNPHLYPQAGSPQLPHHFQAGTSYPPYPQAPANFGPQIAPIRSLPTNPGQAFGQMAGQMPGQAPGMTMGSGAGPEARRSSRQQDRRDSLDSNSDSDRRHRKYRSSGRDKERSRGHRHDKEKSMKRLGTLATVGALAGLLEHL